MKVLVVIPLYKASPNDNEIKSLIQCFKILKNHPIKFITFKELNVKKYIEEIGLCNNYSFEYFDKSYFESINGYNKLMLSKSFYKPFIKFNYLLIYQLDSWIFKDELLKWCNKGYDYVGAPWVNWPWSDYQSKNLTIVRKCLNKLGVNNFNLVGNGGLSLRKVNSCIANLILFYFNASRFKQNEDYFFSFFITSYNPFFKVAPFSEALKFSFDVNPQVAFELNNQDLPMGCHAWHKYLQFWNDKLK